MIPRTVFAPEHEEYRSSYRKFLDRDIAPHHAKWEEDGVVAREAWRKAGQAGFLCPSMPEEYGGAGADRLYSAVLFEEQAALGLTGLGFGLHSEIVAPYILRYGNDEMKRAWLPKMAAGEAIGAIAMSEPAAGSDLQGVKTTAARSGNEYVINGQKTFITNGQNADIVIVVAKTDPKAGAKGVSLFIVEATREGFTKGRNLQKIGMKAQDTSELFFADVRVPPSNMLGAEGQGFAYLMQELPWERLQIAIAAVASAEAALQGTIEYTKQRKAFGQAIAAFQTTRFKLAEIKTEVQIARVFVDRCMELVVADKLDGETAAMAKYWCSDLQCRVIDECLQLHGGYGYMWEYPIARAYADARVQRIYGGTNEIMKEVISRGL
jgi:alkylation response protein AidB-like acyl-CoA dehydrogenase